MHSRINVSDFNLAATLECGQAFRWSRDGTDDWFTGVVGREVWRLRQDGNTLEWEVVSSISHQPSTISHDPASTTINRYLALDASLPNIVKTFPADDMHLHAAIQKHWGLRVLRQQPWECLASFMASSTKQIVQIRQIVAELSRRFGEPVGEGFHTFPTVGAIAGTSHKELWDCKLGFRAKNLLAAARLINDGKIGLNELPAMEYERALEELLKLPGVGDKIANCVLLFSCGFEQAFPVDVWIERALRRIYFPRRKVTARQLREFARSHFGLYAGWAQQYLFFQERTRQKNHE
jgi:N-glycosylase/DNA lyase